VHPVGLQVQWNCVSKLRQQLLIWRFRQQRPGTRWRNRTDRTCVFCSRLAETRWNRVPAAVWFSAAKRSGVRSGGGRVVCRVRRRDTGRGSAGERGRTGGRLAAGTPALASRPSRSSPCRRPDLDVRRPSTYRRQTEAILAQSPRGACRVQTASSLFDVYGTAMSEAGQSCRRQVFRGPCLPCDGYPVSGTPVRHQSTDTTK